MIANMLKVVSTSTASFDCIPNLNLILRRSINFSSILGWRYRSLLPAVALVADFSSSLTCVLK